MNSRAAFWLGFALATSLLGLVMFMVMRDPMVLKVSDLANEVKKMKLEIREVGRVLREDTVVLPVSKPKGPK